MSTKRIIILGGGFGGVKCAETLRDELPLGHTGNVGGMYRLSRRVLLAREDKTFQDALVTSMRIPWVETKGHDDLGRYQELAEVAAPIRLARRRRRPNALGNQRVEIERRWTR